MTNTARKNAIVWFRQDLRLRDNPALTAASKSFRVIPIYIFDDQNAEDAALGSTSKLWLHHSLKALNASLDDKLRFLSGDPQNLLLKLAAKDSVEAIFWNRVYEPWQTKRDKNIKKQLTERGYKVNSFNASLLWEPWNVTKKDGSPYKVFTPFYRKGCLGAKPPRIPISKPKLSLGGRDESCGLDKLNELNLIPKKKWWPNLINNWNIGEDAAIARLHEFLRDGLDGYKEGRNYPIKNNVSRLSPYLHWGEISANTIWHETKHFLHYNQINEQDADVFFSELGWREFSHSLLYYFPELPSKNLQERFNSFEWCNNSDFFKAWKTGKTGYPIVDAGMIELYQTGYMHNRLRMIVGSFLVKNLLIDWRQGEKWFWDCLVDANLANNSAGWQWIAGCGADAAPYFRIFNPVTQGEKFDPDGSYTKKYLPELKHLSVKNLFAPWLASKDVLSNAGVVLGTNYPYPIIDLKQSREKALASFAKLKRL